MEALIPLFAIVCLFVILPGMAFYYADRKRRWKQEQTETSSIANSELVALADRMEKRIESLERILDAEAPGWRKRHHE